MNYSHGITSFGRRRGLNKWLLLLIASLLVSACSQEGLKADDSPEPLPTLTANVVLAAQATSNISEATAETTNAAELPTSTPAPTITSSPSPSPTPTVTPAPSPTATPTHPLMIEVMRQDEYPGSELTIEEQLSPGSNYDRFVVSYLSEEYKIFALMTVPWGEAPPSGWPVIIFNHGYIPPDEYRTTERYVDYVDGFAREGYIVFKSDYRGHGDSEGGPSGGYGSPDYTIDVLNGLASVKKFPAADPERVGMWGHSMGGNITLRAMVVSEEIEAGVIWGGVVASYPDLFERWRRRAGDGPTPTPDPTRTRGRWRSTLFDTFGTPEDNPEFWASISPNTFVADLSGPLQLHHATTDASVPVEYSQTLYSQIQAVGKPTELYLYEGDNHNIFANFGTAMRRTIDYFDIHVKGEG